MGHSSSDVRCNEPGNPRMCQYRNASAVWVNTLQSCSGNNAVRRNNSCVGAHDFDGDGDPNNDPAPAAVPAYYYVFDVTNAAACALSGADTNNACYDIKIVSTTSGPGTLDLNGDGVINATDRDERQNFANWYSFARTRNLATITAASLAFAALDPSARLAWQALNTCRGSTSNFVNDHCDGWKNTLSVSNAIRPYTGTHKGDFYAWMSQLPTEGNTPLPAAMTRAGNYYTTHGENSPYDNEFGVGIPASTLAAATITS